MTCKQYARLPQKQHLNSDTRETKSERSNKRGERSNRNGREKDQSSVQASCTYCSHKRQCVICVLDNFLETCLTSTALRFYQHSGLYASAPVSFSTSISAPHDRNRVDKAMGSMQPASSRQ